MATDARATLGITMGSIIRRMRKKFYPDRGGLNRCTENFGTSVTNWVRWEGGKVIPSEENQQKIAEFFDITTGQLRGEIPFNEDIVSDCEHCRQKDLIIDDLRLENFALHMTVNSLNSHIEKIKEKYKIPEIDATSNTLSFKEIFETIVKPMASQILNPFRKKKNSDD